MSLMIDVQLEMKTLINAVYSFVHIQMDFSPLIVIKNGLTVSLEDIPLADVSVIEAHVSIFALASNACKCNERI